MQQDKIEFEKIIPTEEQTENLYLLFKQRLHRISAEGIDYSKHSKFVTSHPYRAWYLIKFNYSYIGSFYVSKENTVGLNIQDNFNQNIVKKVITFVRNNYKPLPPILSIRSKQFIINVPPENNFLIKALENLGAQLIQRTYSLPTDKTDKGKKNN